MTLNNGKWSIGKHEAPATSKKLNAEGPLGDAFASRHVYVFGTGGDANPEEITKRKQLAEQAANWALYRNAFLGRVMFFPRVVSDQEVRPSDLETSNLILFGTKETNTLIEKFADQLPLHLHADATNYGLFYIYPINGKYVAISSGLPWWQGQTVQGFRFMSEPALKLGVFKDFMFFKDSAATILTEGYFDEQWKLTETDKQKIKASGVVDSK